MSKLGIFFDLDGTLIHTTSSREERFVTLTKKLGLNYSLSQVKKAYRYGDQWWEKHKLKLSDYTRQNLQRMNQIILKQLGTEGKVEDTAERLTILWEEIPWSKPYPEVEEVLNILSEDNLRLGILSHRSITGINRALKSLGWTDLFSCKVSPMNSKTSTGKNDPRMWKFGMEKIGLDKNRLFHVGDEYETDVVGAEKMGIVPLLIDRTGKYKNKNLQCLKSEDLGFLLHLLRLR